MSLNVYITNPDSIDTPHKFALSFNGIVIVKDLYRDDLYKLIAEINHVNSMSVFKQMSNLEKWQK